MFDQFVSLGGLPDENAVEAEAEGISIAENEAQEETGVEGSSPPETSGTLPENARPDEEPPSAADEKAIHTAEAPEEDSGEQLPENTPAIGQTLHVDGRSYEIESISALSKEVHLRDLDFQRENGYPISRVEPYSVVQGWLKEQAEPWIPGHESAKIRRPNSLKPSSPLHRTRSKGNLSHRRRSWSATIFISPTTISAQAAPRPDFA